MPFLIGVDEAGRGPLAGPVAVGAAMISRNFDWARLPGVRDSKKMTPKARESVYEAACLMREEGALAFAVSFSSAAHIDEHGIVASVSSALAQALAELDAEPDSCEVLLDGSLRAPDRFLSQKTIIRGDDSEPVISLASIVAKVERDRLMTRLSLSVPGYGFEVHKGYGTRRHCDAIRELGLSAFHRVSFCSGLRISQKSV